MEMEKIKDEEISFIIYGQWEQDTDILNLSSGQYQNMTANNQS